MLSNSVDWINSAPEYIGMPEAVVHKFHIEVDKGSEYGLKGLPLEWRMYLEASGLTKQEIQDKPEEVLNVLLVSSGQRQAKPPLKKDFEDEMRKIIDFKKNDPSEDLHFDSKIGKGGQGMVFLVWRKGNTNEKYAVKLMKVKDKSSEDKIRKEIAMGILSLSDVIINFYDMYKFKE